MEDKYVSIIRECEFWEDKAKLIGEKGLVLHNSNCKNAIIDLVSRAEVAENELSVAIGGLVGQCKYCRKNKECISRKGSHIYCLEWSGIKKEEN